MPQFWKVRNLPFEEGSTSELRSMGPKLVHPWPSDASIREDTSD